MLLFTKNVTRKEKFKAYSSIRGSKSGRHRGASTYIGIRYQLFESGLENFGLAQLTAEVGKPAKFELLVRFVPNFVESFG